MTSHEPGAGGLSFVNEGDAPQVEAQPRVEVHCWRLLKAPSGTLHLVTLRDRSEQGATVRVTSAITAVDAAAGIVTTSTGRQYVLLGPFETQDFEVDLLHRGAVRLGMADSVDVSVLAWDQVEIR
ncbi:MAG: hypothetical protein ACK44A_00150 [Roseateles sp.]